MARKKNRVPQPISEIEVALTPGQMLEAAVAEFENLFTAVDDAYMHGDNSRTAAGTRFRKIVPGTVDVTEMIAYQDHTACVADWLAGAKAAKNGTVGKLLLWRVQPHFIQIPGRDGFSIVSSFAVESIPADEAEAPKTRRAPVAKVKAVPASDDPAHDLPASLVSGPDADPAEPEL